jgi:hypothetical protein
MTRRVDCPEGWSQSRRPPRALSSTIALPDCDDCAVTPEEYVKLVANRLDADGSRVATETLSGGEALVGTRSAFRLDFGARKLNLFTVVVSADRGGAGILEHLANDALDYATQRKGRVRGLQNSVAAIAVLVCYRADRDTAWYATEHIVKRFGAFAWPVLVELETGELHRHEGRVVAGRLYARWMRERIAITLPDPAIE